MTGLVIVVMFLGLTPSVDAATQDRCDALVVSLQSSNPDVRADAARKLGAIGPAACTTAPFLIECLASDEFTSEGVRVWAIMCETLGKMGTSAIPDLIAGLESTDYRVCQCCAVALHDIGPDVSNPAVTLQAVEGLIRIIELDDLKTRKAAMHGLTGIGPASQPAIPILIESLTHKDFHTQYFAAKALGGIGTDAQVALPALIDRLANGVATVRYYAAQAIGNIGVLEPMGEGSLAVVVALRDAKDNDQCQPVREMAAEALVKLATIAEEVQ